MNDDSNKSGLWIAAAVAGAIIFIVLVSELGAGGLVILSGIGIFGWLKYRKMTDDADRRQTELAAGVTHFDVRNDADAERAVLMVARDHGGLVTIPQIILETTLSAEEADRTIERLSKRGLVTVELDDAGVVYHVAGLLKRPDADRAA
jgi:hypothetical protein